MLYNVAKLLQEPIGSIRHYVLDEPSGIEDPDLVLIGPIHSDRVTLMRTQRGILVTAVLTQTVRMQCVRCLADVDVPLEITLEEEYFPSIDLKTGLFIDWSHDEDVTPEVMIDEKHILDLHEVVRQELLLALPLHPLCRPDCRGICPNCGADLNTEPCRCEEKPVDPRWEALAKLKKTLSEE